MGGLILACGCSISWDMFQHITREVHHCPEHWHLFSQDKTLREMAEEIRALQTSREGQHLKPEGGELHGYGKSKD